MNIKRKEESRVTIIVTHQELNSTLKKLKLPPFSIIKRGEWREWEYKAPNLYSYDNFILDCSDMKKIELDLILANCRGCKG